MTNEAYNEIQVLQSCAAGNTAAFEVIVQKYQSLICAITYSAVGQVEKSEELAQQVFINAWKGLSQLNDFNNFKAWLVGITRNVIRTFYRTQKRDIVNNAAPLDRIGDTPGNSSEPLETIITKEQEMIVEQSLQQIPEKYREPMVLFYRQQQSTREVAEALDLTEDTVRARLMRGRKMLKEQVSSMIESTLSNTGPGKAFTTMAVASIAGLAMTSTAAAATASTSAAVSSAGSTGLTALTASITAKIVTAATVITVAVGAMFVYTQNTKSASTEPEMSQSQLIVDTQEDVQEQAVGVVTAQLSIEKTNPPEYYLADAVVQNENQPTQQTNETGVVETENPVNDFTDNFSDSPYDHFLFTSFSQRDNTRTLVLAELTEEGFKLHNIDTNQYAMYRWDEPLCVIDGILYAVRRGDLLSMDLTAPGSDGFNAIGFELKPEYEPIISYADGRLYGYIENDKNTRVYRALDFKTKAYRDITPFERKLSYPVYSGSSLAVSPDHKRLAFFAEDPNGFFVTALDMDSGQILQANKSIDFMMPMIASLPELPSLVWLDTEKVLTISTDQMDSVPGDGFGRAVNTLTIVDVTTGEVNGVLSLPGNAEVRFAPDLIQDSLGPGPRVIMRNDLGEYRFDVAADELVEDDWINGDYFIIDGYLFHGEDDLGPATRKDLKVSPDGKRAMWVNDGKLLFYDSAAKTVQVVTETHVVDAMLLWFTNDDLNSASEAVSIPEGWIAFKDYRKPEQQEQSQRGPNQLALSKVLSFTMNIDKTQYQLHEPIEITVELTNISDVDVAVFMPAVFGLEGSPWDAVNLDCPGGSRMIEHGAGPYEPKKQEIILKPYETVSAIDTLEVSRIGAYQVKCTYVGPRNNSYRGDLKAGPISFNVVAKNDAEKEEVLFEAKFNRLIERFYGEIERAPGWNGANDTVDDELIGIPGLGTAVAPYLIEVINNEENENARNLLFRALTAVADEQSLPFFKERLSQGESEPVCKWLYSLYRKKRDANESANEPLNVLLSGMKHGVPSVRLDVTSQLVRIYDPNVVRCLEIAAEKDDEVVQIKAARYLAAAEWLELSEWLALAAEQPTYTRYIVVRSIIKELEGKWNITKDSLPDMTEMDFAKKNETLLKRYTEIVNQWQEWASENPRYSFHFFDDDRKDWIVG